MNLYRSPGLPHTMRCNSWFRGQGRTHLHQKLLVRLKSLDTGCISLIQPFEVGVRLVLPQLRQEVATERKGLDDILQNADINIMHSSSNAATHPGSWQLAGPWPQITSYPRHVLWKSQTHTLVISVKTRTRRWHQRSHRQRKPPEQKC